VADRLDLEGRGDLYHPGGFSFLAAVGFVGAEGSVGGGRMNYWFNIAIYLCIYAILALSLNVVTGFGGLINMSHAAFFGVAAYTTALP
jgi:ABC-type branched-subunit amino acid transport system permease subunit